MLGEDGTVVQYGEVTLFRSANDMEGETVLTDGYGAYRFTGLEDGMYTLVITCPDYLESNVQVTVNDGFVKNMFNLSLTSVQRLMEIDDDAFAFSTGWRSPRDTTTPLTPPLGSCARSSAPHRTAAKVVISLFI